MKFLVYSKTAEAFRNKISRESVENLLDASVSEDKNERNEGLHALVYMFDVHALSLIYRENSTRIRP